MPATTPHTTGRMAVAASALVVEHVLPQNPHVTIPVTSVLTDHTVTFRSGPQPSGEGKAEEAGASCLARSTVPSLEFVF